MSDLTVKFMGNEFISYENIDKIIPGDTDPFINSLFEDETLDYELGINWESHRQCYLIKLDTLIDVNLHKNLHIHPKSKTRIYIDGFVFMKVEKAFDVYKGDTLVSPLELIFSIKPTQFSLIDNEKHDFETWITLDNVSPIINNYKSDKALYSEMTKHFRSISIGDRKIIDLIPKFVEFEHFVHAYSCLYGGENFPKLSKQINDSGYTYNESAKQSEYTTGSIDPNNEKNNNSYMENLIKLFGSATKKNYVRLIESVLINMERGGKYLTENNTAQEFQSYLINNDIDSIYEIQGDKIILNDGETELTVKGMMKSFRRQIKKLN